MITAGDAAQYTATAKDGLKCHFLKKAITLFQNGPMTQEPGARRFIALIAQDREDQGLAAVLLDQAEVLDKSVNAMCEEIKNTRRQISKEVSAVLMGIPDELRQGAQAGAHKAIQGATADVAGSLKTATKSLKSAAAEGQATARALSRSGIMQGVFLLAVAVVVGLIGWAGVGFMINSRAEELANLKAQVKAEKATLAAMQSETWGIELVIFGDGGRAIVLPKGYKYKYDGDMKDKNGKKTGRIGVAIEPF